MGLIVAVHKLILFTREVKSRVKLYSETGVRHDPERIRDLVEMRRSEMVGELMQFMLAANWMRLSLPYITEVVAPLRALMESHLQGTVNRKVILRKIGRRMSRRLGRSLASCWKMRFS